MSPQPKRSGKRGRLSKRPAYLNDYWLDNELEQPPAKSPRLHLSIEQESSEEEPMVVDQSLPHEEQNQESSRQASTMDLSELVNLIHSMKSSVDSMKTEMKANMTKVDDNINNMNQQINSVRNQIEAISVPTTTPPAAPDGLEIAPAPELSQSQNNPEQQITPTDVATTISGSSTSSFISGRKVLIDLPQFNGDYDQWPIFISDFNDSTESEGYTTLQNNSRLKKCLIGKARKCVDSMLIHHQNVPDVIERLRVRFGDPEKIIKTQIDKVKAVQPITENRMELLVSFADDVNNMKNVLKSCNSQHCLTNSTLLEELVLKMPYSKRWEWQKHRVNLRPYPTIEHFSDWLNQEAAVADCVTIPTSSFKAMHQKKERGRVLLVNTNTQKFTCNVCKMDHKTVDCTKFIQMTPNARWELTTKEKLCFKCLEKGHRTQTCRRPPCGLNGCRRPHHKLLHTDVPSNLNANAETFEPTNTERVCMSAQFTDETNVLFKVIPIKLYGPKGEKNTFALLDEASTLTLVHSRLANELGLKGEKSFISIKGIDNTVKVKESEIVDSKISGTYPQAAVYDLKGIRVVDGLDLPVQNVDMKALCAKFKQFENSPIQDIKGLPEILIGLKHAHLGAPMHVPLHNGKGPILIKTKLGYLMYGPKDDHEIPEQEVQRVLLSDIRPTMVELHNMVQHHYTVEDFGVRCVEQVQSSEDKRALDILEKTTRRICGGFECYGLKMSHHYRIAI